MKTCRMAGSPERTQSVTNSVSLVKMEGRNKTGARIVSEKQTKKVSPAQRLLPALERQGQEDQKFKASLSHTVSLGPASPTQ